MRKIIEIFLDDLKRLFKSPIATIIIIGIIIHMIDRHQYLNDG